MINKQQKLNECYKKKCHKSALFLGRNKAKAQASSSDAGNSPG